VQILSDGAKAPAFRRKIQRLSVILTAKKRPPRGKKLDAKVHSRREGSIHSPRVKIAREGEEMMMMVRKEGTKRERCLTSSSSST